MSSKILFINAFLVDENMACNGSLLVNADTGLIEKIFEGTEIQSQLHAVQSELGMVQSKLIQARSELHAARADVLIKHGSQVVHEDNAENYEDDNVFAKNPNTTIIDCKGKTLMPAFVDMHVHFRDPGQTQKEDLNSGLHAAVAGGYTTVVAMPNTSPVISSVNAAKHNMNVAAELGLADLYQTMSITKNFNGMDTSPLDELMQNKTKLRASDTSTCNQSNVKVISEDGHDVLDSHIMLKGMQKAALADVIVACHCEDPNKVVEARESRKSGDFARAEGVLQKAENEFTERNIQLAQKAKCHIHICHISTAKAIEAVRSVKSDVTCIKSNAVDTAPKNSKFSITAEATPHHLGLSYEMDAIGHRLVNPPLRSEKDRQAVIAGLKDGTIDCIGTDHAPHTFQDKKNGACGFSGLEIAFSVCNTTLVRGGTSWQQQTKNLKWGQINRDVDSVVSSESFKKIGFTLSELSKLMSANPARILKIAKGQLSPGYKADLVLVDPKKIFTVDAKAFVSKGKNTPFNGLRLFGKVLETWKDAKKVYPK